MKIRTISTAVMVIAVVAFSTGMVHAGGGGNGLGGVLFFQCYWIQSQGMNPPHELEVNDQFTDPTNVKVGTARLVCTPADAAVTNNVDITVVDPFTADHITCYEVASSTPHAVITLTDPFGEQTVRLGASKFVCVQAIKECVSGCPVIGP